MKRKISLALSTIAIILVLSGCQTGGGIPQAQYDQVNARLADAQSSLAEIQTKLTQAQNGLVKAQADKAAVDAQLQDAQARIASLQSQAGQSSLVGATPAETAAKIVKYYHETHIYSAYDLFVCSDMASEVWNMLKAQNISAVIVVGNKDALISDILLSNHAWVLATVGPNEVLALETTGGMVVTRNENPLYYLGWSFQSPADLKANNDMVKEYNLRVSLRNDLAAEDRKVIAEYNKSPSDKLEAVHNKLVELVQAQEAYLNDLMNNIKKLATVVS